MKNKVCTGEIFRTLDNTSNFNKAFKCKKECLNTKWCQQIGFVFDSLEGKRGTCHLYQETGKMQDIPVGQRTKCGKVFTEIVPAATSEPTSEPSSGPSFEP